MLAAGLTRGTSFATLAVLGLAAIAALGWARHTAASKATAAAMPR